MRKVPLLIVLFLTVFLVSCKKPTPVLTIETKSLSLTVGDVFKLDPVIEGLNEFVIIYSVDNQDVIEVTDGEISAIQEGTAIVTIFIKDREDIPSVEVSVTVSRKLNPSIKISGPQTVKKGDQITLTVDLVDLSGDVVWTSEDITVATVSAGVVTGVSGGVVTIKANCNNYIDTFEVTVIDFEDTEAPVFKFNENYQHRTILNWNKEFDPLTGLQAVDNVDGDITNKVKVVKGFDNQEYGLHTIELEVTDSSGNTQTLSREVEVVWNYDVTFIGHAGSFYGLMNSEEALLYAVEVLKYQALECDLKQTSDGVFILSHDDTFAGYNIASTPWSVLKDVERTASRNSGIPAQNGSVKNSPYTTKLCSLERYLEICKEYNVTAVIELKYSNGINNNDQSRMQALMNEIEKAGMRENVILLASQYNCLIWTRNNGYSDIPCQYLVGSFESQTILQRCIDYDLDISINVTGSHSNNDEWFAKYVEAGRKISAYTFTQYVDYPEVQRWINKGVDFVTCDWQLMDKLQLPEKSDVPLPTYEVTFKDFDGAILKQVAVKEGQTAAAPMDPKRLGYSFIGWSNSINNIKNDLEVIAKYEIENYTITYDANVDVVNETVWASKSEFIDEFYSDLYNWLLTNGANIKEVTVTGAKVVMTKNGKSVSFSSVDELKQIDKYDFEKTISNIIYKPVIRANDDSTTIEPSEEYFLNSELYRIKYQALDAWFVNCINVAYSAYDKTYTPLSDGRIQIMFRFHQWQQGTSIAAFNTLPKKFEYIKNSDYVYQLPTTNLSYTIEDDFYLPPATGNHDFMGWFLDKEFTQAIEKISKGMTGNLVLYAKWN